MNKMIKKKEKGVIRIIMKDSSVFSRKNRRSDEKKKKKEESHFGMGYTLHIMDEVTTLGFQQVTTTKFFIN
jgi:hypothetical protein